MEFLAGWAEPAGFAFLSFLSLLVVVDPVGLVPPFLAMTPSDSTEDRVRMIRSACRTAFGVLLFFLLFGRWILQFLNLSIEAFQIAGGIVLMIIALDMLRARPTGVRQSSEEKDAGTDKDDIAVTPLAIPLLAGPGSITTVVLFAQHSHSPWRFGILAVNLLIVMWVSYGILRYAALKSINLSVILLKVLTRLMGLLLAAISVQFVLSGIREFMGFSGRI